MLNEQASMTRPVELEYSGYEDDNFNKALDNMHLQYQLGNIPKLNHAEREILEFCDARDMREFIREEFEKHPIKLNDNGELVGENPFEKERRMWMEMKQQQPPAVFYEQYAEHPSVYAVPDSGLNVAIEDEKNDLGIL